jgi:hypothetical protein
MVTGRYLLCRVENSQLLRNWKNYYFIRYIQNSKSILKKLNLGHNIALRHLRSVFNIIFLHTIMHTE